MRTDVMTKRSSENEKMEIDDGPSFYKLILDDLPTETMRIPTQFLKNYLSEEPPQKAAVLKGPSGDEWEVKLHKDENGTHFQEGWRQFSGAHSLGNNEFLLFTYDGNMSFQVEIYENNGCIKFYDSKTLKRGKTDASEKPRDSPKKSPTTAVSHDYKKPRVHLRKPPSATVADDNAKLRVDRRKSHTSSVSNEDAKSRVRQWKSPNAGPSSGGHS